MLIFAILVMPGSLHSTSSLLMNAGVGVLLLRPGRIQGILHYFLKCHTHDHDLIPWPPHLWYYGNVDHIPGVTLMRLYMDMNMNVPL
jgi:hypothetical protein